MNKKILLIGNGKMGSAFTNQLHDKFNFSVVSPNSEPKVSVPYYTSVDQVKGQFDYMIFAVKPWILPSIIPLLNKTMYHKNTVFVSIITGASLSFFQKCFGTDAKIVRVMPNLPTHIGKGIMAVYPKIEVEFLKTMGRVIHVDEELDINKFTSFTGSGSGFVFSMLEMYQNAHKKLDISTKFDEKEVIIELFEGAIEQLKQSNMDFKQLKDNVVVARGTTFEGLKALSKCEPLFEESMLKAFNRANEICIETMEKLEEKKAPTINHSEKQPVIEKKETIRKFLNQSAKQV